MTDEPPPGTWPAHGERGARTAQASRGRAARTSSPRSAHGEWAPAPDRADPVAILRAQASSRVPDLVPIRNARMSASAFAFYRGAAAVMAADLAGTPTSGVTVQLCGDAHLSNFGGYAAPDRTLVFDINDFDETLPGPWEWDLKRLVASVEIVSRERGFDERDRRAAVHRGAREYRRAMLEFAEQGALQVWYARLTADDIRERWGVEADVRARRGFERQIAKATRKDNVRAASRLTEVVDGRARILSDPPLLVPLADLGGTLDTAAVEHAVSDVLLGLRRSLPPGTRRLLEQFHYVDAARKVVGVGSVGTRAWVVLLHGLDDEPLLLQLKEAQESVLAPYAGRSTFANQGHRVVAGQQVLQTSSDIFLGWTQIPDGVVDRDYYVRQLADWKISAQVERFDPQAMGRYAEMCAWALARAHARYGSRVAIAAYLGGGSVFDDAMVEFAAAYADQNEADHRRFLSACRDGELDVDDE